MTQTTPFEQRPPDLLATKYPVLAGKTQLLVYRWLWHHPGSTLKQAAQALGISYNATKLAWSRLRRKKSFQHLCPLCLHFALYGEACQNCGYEPNGFDDSLPGFLFTVQSPRYRLQENGGLGSFTDYQELRPKYGAKNLEHLVEHGPEEDRILLSLRSGLWEVLKGSMLDDGKTDLAARILESEYNRFRVLYPQLLRKRGFRDAILKATLHRLRLLGVRVSLQ
jgi:hypothetical protein